MLEIESVRSGHVTTLRLEGDIDEDGATALRIAMVRCLREKEFDVIVSMSGVKFISYMGVGILVERLRQFRSNGGDLKLAGLNLYAERLFRMIGVTTLFETYPDEEQALKVYQKAA